MWRKISKACSGKHLFRRRSNHALTTYYACPLCLAKVEEVDPPKREEKEDAALEVKNAEEN